MSTYGNELFTFMMEDPRTISRGIDLIWCARALERIGDPAKNVFEYIIYRVEGKDLHHTNLDKLER